MQFFTNFFPNHLPKRMEEYRDKYEHHWVIETSDEAIDESREYFNEFFKNNEGDFFECNDIEGEKALLHRFVAGSAIGRYHAIHQDKVGPILLHRFVAGSAIGRYHAIHQDKVGPMMSLDIAFPRNEKDWFEKLPKEIDDLIEVKLHYGHLFCHVFHQNYIVKKGVDAKLLSILQNTMWDMSMMLSQY
jgi:D-lactate dehydrogenase